MSVHAMGRVVVAALTIAIASLAASGETSSRPVISNVFPDFDPPVRVPHVITGENFDPNTTEVWCWQGSADSPTTQAALNRLGQPMTLPTEPPKGACRAAVLDVESQVIVANLQGVVVWVKTAQGWSQPCLFGTAHPFWISRDKAPQGAVLRMFGFGLQDLWRTTRVVLKAQDGNVLACRRMVTSGMGTQEPRLGRSPDSRLVLFEVPADAPPGKYEVYVHNGLGGDLGWAKAGDLEVAARGGVSPKVLDVRDYGAKGDGLANDLLAIRKALAEAAKAVPSVVHLPPGTYRTDETIIVPQGVTLRGSGRENTILLGFGYDETIERTLLTAWFTMIRSAPTAILRLGDNTGLEALTVRGATSKGAGGDAIVEAVPREIRFPDGGEVRDVMIRDCLLDAREADSASGRWLYTAAIYVGPCSRNVSILDNDIHGAAGNLSLGRMAGYARRMDIIGNTFHGPGTDIVSLGCQGYDCLVDDNRFVDSPGRLVFNPRRHCYIRFNEIHHMTRGTWNNAGETFLLHGSMDDAVKTAGYASAGAEAAMTDRRQSWKPGLLRDAAVLIISGRGMGQYRTVIANTGDTLTVDRPWRVAPDATSGYVVGPMYVENALFCNLNDTPGVLSLWLDCIANVVEMHRDQSSAGVTAWGSDGASIDANGVARNVNRFCPSWYNMIVNGWQDGAGISLVGGNRPDSPHLGPTNFATFIVRNKVRQSQSSRTCMEAKPAGSAAIHVVGSHTIVADNYIASGEAGVSIAPGARKTFLLGNDFADVGRPLLDQGGRTIGRGNRTWTADAQGPSRVATSLPDIAEMKDAPPRSRPAFTLAEADMLPPLYHTVAQLKAFVSGQTVLGAGAGLCVYEGVGSEKRQCQCEGNLKAVFELLRKYDHDNGHLPKATFFPASPLADSDSLAVMLGKESLPMLVCPTCSADLRTLGLNYIWNERISGQKLSEIKNPQQTWLMMDFVAVNQWMVLNACAGHRGGVNVLYADGSIKWLYPFPPKEGNNDWVREEKSLAGWLEWARGGP